MDDGTVDPKLRLACCRMVEEATDPDRAYWRVAARIKAELKAIVKVISFVGCSCLVGIVSLLFRQSDV